MNLITPEWKDILKQKLTQVVDISEDIHSTYSEDITQYFINWDDAEIVLTIKKK